MLVSVWFGYRVEPNHNSPVQLTYVFLPLAVISTLIPHKKKSVVRLVTSAMIAGNTACFITAAIAGLFYQSNVDTTNV